jgi:hypothetical protein
MCSSYAAGLSTYQSTGSITLYAQWNSSITFDPYRLVPQRTFKVVVMVFVGAFFGAWMQSLFASPKVFLKWSFVLLAIPGVIFSVMEWMTDEPEKNWKESSRGRWAYRILGVVVFILTVQMVRGVDLSDWLFGVPSG